MTPEHLVATEYTKGLHAFERWWEEHASMIKTLYQKAYLDGMITGYQLAGESILQSLDPARGSHDSTPA